MDLTKYIEEHNFNFDNVFDETADNRQVTDIVNYPDRYIKLVYSL